MAEISPMLVTFTYGIFESKALEMESNALTVRFRGMCAENDCREDGGLSPAYDEEAFTEIEKKFEALAAKIRALGKEKPDEAPATEAPRGEESHHQEFWHCNACDEACDETSSREPLCEACDHNSRVMESLKSTLAETREQKSALLTELNIERTEIRGMRAELAKLLRNHETLKEASDRPAEEESRPSGCALPIDSVDDQGDV